jgi:3-phenylpropionate/trans-cinnamate dioxygenase ferredoxin reductase subunit
MEICKYLIIGGGMSADSAVKGIRSIDKEGKIGLISAEPNPPYDRPPLSKGLWKGNIKFEDIWRPTPKKGIELYLSRTVQKIDRVNKLCYDDKAEAYQYEKLLIATGGRPRHLPNDLPEVIYYRTVDDYKRLKQLARGQKELCVIGGGFIGAEVAAALAIKKKKVTMVFPEKGILGLIFPERLSLFLNSYYAEKGVTVLAGEKVASMTRTGKKIQIQTEKGDNRQFDGVVAGLGIIPNTELAQSALLKVDNGIIVDTYLRTSDPNIFASGDVANFESPHLGKRIRVEHEDNANTMGELAGKNMAGYMRSYTHLPYFYSDLFDLGYEAVGQLSSKLQTAIDWKEEFEEGVIYYLDQGRISGILLWNVWEQVDAARELIAQKGPFGQENVVGLLPRKM